MYLFVKSLEDDVHFWRLSGLPDPRTKEQKSSRFGNINKSQLKPDIRSPANPVGAEPILAKQAVYGAAPNHHVIMAYCK